MFERLKEKRFLKVHPLCAVCMRQGRYTKATHIFIMTNGYKESRCDGHKPKMLN